LNWPRTPLVLGFVVAHMLEGSYQLTAELWGWRIFSRPLFLVMLSGIVIWLAVSVLRKSPLRIMGPRRLTILASGSFALAFTAMAVSSTTLPPKLAAFPLAASVLGALLCSVIAMMAFASDHAHETKAKITDVGLTAAFLVATPVVGLPVATLGFAARMLTLRGLAWPRALFVSVAFCVVQITILSLVYDVLVEREIIGRLMWLALGY
jgi:hypothetical protein